MAAPLKNSLDRVAITRLAKNLARIDPTFLVQPFVKKSLRGLQPLALKERVGHVAEALSAHLPTDYHQALDVIVQASDGWDRGNEDDPMRGFAAWPLFHFIEQRGVAPHTVAEGKRSLSALREITHLFSAEFAVRPFLAAHPKAVFAEFARWTKDKRPDVRRLVSEGTRSRLPWASKVQMLIDDPEPTLALLERLKDDDSLYVRRSVANNLNDLAKDHPDRVLDLCEAWQKGASADRLWVIERATRTLVKDGHPRVWGLLGFTPRPKVEASPVALTPKRVPAGGDIAFSFSLQSNARTSQRLAIDYALHFVKANSEFQGQGTKPKVFKLKVLNLAAGATEHLHKTYSFRAISTRKYYPGRHAIEVLVNGNVQARGEFELLAGPNNRT